MNNLILQIFGIASVFALIQSHEWYQKLLLKTNLDLKPFNCTLCMTFWLGTPIFIAHYDLNGIIYGCLTAFVAEMMDRKLMEL